MRYRRLSHRYTIVTAPMPRWTLAELWRGNPNFVLGRGQWQPDADMRETRATVDISVDLAGVGEDDFEIQLFDDALVLEGWRQLPPCDEDSVYHTAQIKQGPFRLELPLPASVDPDRVEARYERGLLRISMAKREAAG
jgi:HSP20 family protein